MFEAALKAFLASAQAKYADGLTLQEFGQLLTEFIGLAVDLARDLQNPGPEKKALVLTWIGIAFDTLVPLIPMPVWYRVFVPFVRPVLRQLLLAFAGGMIETLYRNKV